MPDGPAVYVGQVYEDESPDMGARRVKVERLTEHPRDVFDAHLCRYVTETVQMAVCSVVRPNGYRKGAPRVVKVRADRLRPGSRGFRLVAYGCKPGDCVGGPFTGAAASDAVQCEHGRPHVWGEAGWEPVMTLEEAGERLEAGA